MSNTGDFTEKLREISDISVDETLKLLGGAGVYKKAVALCARTMPDNTARLTKLLKTDLSRYSLEVHGIKGVLKNIGAYGLADAADELEKRSKEGNLEECVRLHALFEPKISEFTQRLAEVASEFPLANNETETANRQKTALIKKISYDLDELSKTGEIDAKDAVLNFGSNQAYFAQLTAFVRKSPRYLQYLPDVIVFIEDSRKAFLNEVNILRKEFTRLGLHKTVHIFDDFEEAAQNGITKVLSDKLVQFRAKLKMIKDAAEAAKRITEEKPVILVVDDMPEILAIVTEILNPMYDCVAVTSAKDATESAALYVPDVFLLDIEMPDENGLELAKRLRREACFDETPILFLTCNSKKESVLIAKSVDSMGYILKPVNKEILLTTIRRCLKKITVHP